MKYCRRCQTEKQDFEFGKFVQRKDGLQDWCKACDKAYRLQRKRENPELIRERQRIANRKRYANPEFRKRQNARERAVEPEKFHARAVLKNAVYVGKNYKADNL